MNLQSSATESKPTIYLKDYTSPEFSVEYMHLRFDIHSDHTAVTASMVFNRASNVSPNTPLILFGEDMALQQVSLNGTVLSASEYELTDSQLSLNGVGDRCEIETTVHLKPEENTCLMGLYASNGNMCTQCEPHGFRRITYFLDRPDVMTYFTTRIEADKAKYPVLLSNGNLIDSGDSDNGRHWVRWEDPSLKSAYLFALVAGDFDTLKDTFTTMSGKDVALRMFVERGYGAKSQFALDSLKRAMLWDEQTFGREYDLDIYMIVAVSDFNFGAMENKGLNVFNTSCVLLDQQTATDADYVYVEKVVGHEYFHNWSGNRITLRDWFQLTLKEGLTVFRDQAFTEDMLQSDHCRLMEADGIETRQFAEDGSPLAHPIRPASYIEINNFYTTTVYQKGAEIIRMMQTFMGEDLFREGTDRYFDRYDGQAVTTEHFLGIMKEVYPALDDERFSRWYQQAGTPVLNVSDYYDASKKTYTLTVEQSCRDTPETENKKPFYFPLAIGFLHSDGSHVDTQLEDESEAVSGTRILTVSEQKQSWTFKSVTEKPIPSLLRRLSAPVRCHYDYDDASLHCLWLHDTDTYTRNAAKKQLLTSTVARLADQAKRGEDLTVSPDIFSTVQALTEKEENVCVLAKLISLPEKSYLVQSLSNYSIDYIQPALTHLRKEIGKACAKAFDALLLRHPVQTYEYSVKAQGERAIRSCVYQYLVAADVDAVMTRMEEAYHSADNMTDVMSVLSAINHSGDSVREALMADFLEKWKNEPLVLCKWLSLQGAVERSDTIDRVREITEGDLFDWLNPNIVRGLLGGFTTSWLGFHDAEGRGYALVKDVALRLDKTNPQVASRVARSLANWQSMDKDRQQKMRQVLKDMASTPGISGDLYEIASKSC